MNRLLVMVFVSLVFTNLSCKKTSNADVTYKGVVLFNICSHAVVQTIGTNLIGENHWAETNTTTSHIYDHVFNVQNTCQLGDSLITGDTIMFKLRTNLVQDCNYCMLYVETPNTNYAIQLVN